MPIYEYECRECGVIEVMQGITEEPLKKCPNCKKKVQKLISQSSFHLKGTGWYVTDYGKGNGKGGNGNGAKRASESESASTPAKSESKETKPDKASKPAADKTDKSSKSASASNS